MSAAAADKATLPLTLAPSAGAVSDQAFKGRYRYRVELVSPSEKIDLACFWSAPGRPVERTGMGGGENSGGPVNP